MTLSSFSRSQRLHIQPHQTRQLHTPRRAVGLGGDAERGDGEGHGEAVAGQRRVAFGWKEWCLVLVFWWILVFGGRFLLFFFVFLGGEDALFVFECWCFGVLEDLGGS